MVNLTTNTSRGSRHPTPDWLGRGSKQLYYALSCVVGDDVVLNQLLEAVKAGENAHAWLPARGR
jgi:hypothetical protein